MRGNANRFGHPAEALRDAEGKDEVGWIRDGDSLAATLASLGEGPLALDTEADSFHHYPEKICLIQISMGSGTSLIDPLAGVELTALGAVLEDPGVPTVLHGADYDLRLLRRDHGLQIRSLFDTMIAARLTGETRFGLASLLESHLDVRLDKRFQRADWSRRPLPREMIEYAASDTRHLLELQSILERRLLALGRLEWAEEEFRRLESVQWSAAVRDPEAFRRTKGSSRLDGRALAVLREVWGWRDETARRRDRPPFRVMGDATLVALAVERPESREALARVPGFPRPLVAGKAWREILSRIGRATAEPAEAWPEVRAARPVTDDPAQRKRYRELRRGCDAVATELGLEPSLVASRAVLEGIATKEAGGEDWKAVPELRAWQIRLLEAVVG